MEYEEEVSPEDNEQSSDEDGDIQNMEGLPGDVGLDVEVVLNDDDEHADSDDDDQGSDDMDSEDELGNEDEMDEEDDNEGDGEDDHDWEDAEDDEADYEEDGDSEDDQEETPSHTHHHHHHTHDGSVQHIIRALGGDDEAAMLEQLGENELNMDLDPDGFIEDDMQEDEGKHINSTAVYLKLNRPHRSIRARG